MDSGIINREQRAADWKVLEVGATRDEAPSFTWHLPGLLGAPGCPGPCFLQPPGAHAFTT